MGEFSIERCRKDGNECLYLSGVNNSVHRVRLLAVFEKTSAYDYVIGLGGGQREPVFARELMNLPPEEKALSVPATILIDFFWIAGADAAVTALQQGGSISAHLFRPDDTHAACKPNHGCVRVEIPTPPAVREYLERVLANVQASAAPEPELETVGQD